MPLRDLLKKKSKIGEDGGGGESMTSPTAPEFTFMRTTTTTQEIIVPPDHPGDPNRNHNALSPNTLSPTSPRGSHNPFRRSSRASPAPSVASDDGSGRSSSKEHRLSQRLHLGSRSRATSSSSVNLPTDLPDIAVNLSNNEEDEAKWEKRATLLAQASPLSRPSSSTANEVAEGTRSRSRSVSVSDAGGDVNIQEAIRLHEAGELTQSTAMFGKLADPNGANNALSQVLYGLALRHGWGCTPDPELAITYLSYAASNSAQVENLALQAGMKKGGAAKGELVLAIFELANCFRQGWGIKKDPVAAKQYYETAANLGDTDAMVEVAQCYLDGIGCKKDKFKAAQYLRLAEEKGNKVIGNSWIWKEKYNPKSEGSK